MKFLDLGLLGLVLQSAGAQLVAGQSHAATTVPPYANGTTPAFLTEAPNVTIDANDTDEDGLSTADALSAANDYGTLLWTGLAVVLSGGAAKAYTTHREYLYGKAREREKHDAFATTWCKANNVDTKRSIEEMRAIGGFLQRVDAELMRVSGRPDLHASQLDQKLLAAILNLRRPAVEHILREVGFFRPLGSDGNGINYKAKVSDMTVQKVVGCLRGPWMLQMINKYVEARIVECQAMGLDVNPKEYATVHPMAKGGSDVVVEFDANGGVTPAQSASATPTPPSTPTLRRRAALVSASKATLHANRTKQPPGELTTKVGTVSAGNKGDQTLLP